MDQTPDILRYFSWSHLPPHLQEVSRPFGELAEVVAALPPNREREKALDALLMAKDAAVRAALDAHRLDR